MSGSCAKCDKPVDSPDAELCSLCSLSVTRLMNELTPPEEKKTARLGAMEEPPSVTAAMADSGNRFGRYIRVALLGRGGMGEVWKSWDNDLGRWVALKFPKYEDAGDLVRFQKEAGAMARFSHPNLAAVYEFGQAGGRHFIAMQLVNGDTLGRQPRNNRRRLVKYILDAAQALHSAHLAGFTHRDIKPDNIMIDADSDHVFVMDFGLARKTATPRSTTSIVGTPHYMSPEQAQNLDVDGRSDVYSLGATLYELIGGRPPFEGTQVLEVLNKVVDADPASLRDRDKSVDVDLETVILKCLKKEPELRYATAGELAEDLQRWLAGDEIRARPSSIGYRLRTRIRRQPLAWSLGALLVLSLVGGGIFGAISLSKQQKAAQSAGEKEKDAERSRRLVEAINRVVAHLEEAERLIYEPESNFERIERPAREALRTANENLKAFPEDADLWFYKGVALRLLFEETEAEEALTHALSLDPKMGRAYYQRGQIRMYRFSLESMNLEREMKDAEEIKIRVISLLSEASEDFRRARAADTETEAAAIWIMFTQNDLEAAERAATERIAVRGRTEEFHLLRALVRIRGNRLKEAEPDLAAALDRRPGDWLVWYLRGYIRDAQGRYANSVKDYTRSIELNPELAEAYFNRSKARQDLGDYAASLRDANEYVRRRPDHPQGYVRRAQVHEYEKRYQEAVEDLTKAIDLFPDFQEAHLNRALMFHKLRQFRRAVEDYSFVVERQPGKADAWIGRGNSHRNGGDLDSALSDYNAALRLSPDKVMALVNRGSIYYAKKRYTECLEDSNAVVRLTPRDYTAYVNRALVLRALKRWKAAIADYRETIRLEPWTREKLLPIIRECEKRMDPDR